MDEIRAGARIEVDEKKKSPVDFALWKAAKEGELAFDSSFGKGRPGWHIECSAMSMKYIGETIDIHGGARDLIFPHHENEIAQSEGATGKQFVRHWVHTGFLTVNGEKMAKSLGNFVTVKEILTEHDANALRLFFASTHYRSPVDFSRQALAQAEANAKKIFNTIAIAEGALKEGRETGKADGKLAEEAEKCGRKFTDAMDNDLDTPNALAALFELRTAINSYCAEGNGGGEALRAALAKLRAMLSVLGIEERREVDAEEVGELVGLLIKMREDARRKKDYATSDAIRKQLLEAGIALEDGKDGKVVWKRVAKQG